jgi:hypothetical protein
MAHVKSEQLIDLLRALSSPTSQENTKTKPFRFEMFRCTATEMPSGLQRYQAKLIFRERGKDFLTVSGSRSPRKTQRSQKSEAKPESFRSCIAQTARWSEFL